MWYEILPSLGLVMVFVGIPPFASKVINYFTQNGKTVPRWWDNDNKEYHMYLRDERITGSEYVPRGLEGLPGAEKKN